MKELQNMTYSEYLEWEQEAIRFRNTEKGLLFLIKKREEEDKEKQIIREKLRTEERARWTEKHNKIDEVNKQIGLALNQKNAYERSRVAYVSLNCKEIVNKITDCKTIIKKQKLAMEILTHSLKSHEKEYYKEYGKKNHPTHDRLLKNLRAKLERIK